MYKLERLQIQYRDLIEVVEALRQKANEIAADRPEQARIMRIEANEMSDDAVRLMTKIRRIETYQEARREVEGIDQALGRFRYRLENNAKCKAVIEQFYEKRKKAQVKCELAYRALYLEVI